MNARRPTWRTAGLVAGGCALYAVLGYWLSSNGQVEEWLYRIGLTAATVVPVAFVAVYTWAGLRGTGAWWTDEIGTALVLAALSVIPVTAPLAWTFWVHGGILRSSWDAWLEVSGPCVTALAWARLCWIWLRLSRQRDA